MKIISTEFKNFNSYGNVIQKIDFNQKEGDFYLLIGNNGHGKSTIAEVITFGLYGKVEGKTKGDLPNRINKELWVRIILECKGRLIQIERGVTPNTFDVWIDGKKLDVAGNSNVQNELEVEYFEIPYSVFKNIIILSVNDFRSFLTMSVGDKRNIIDKLFGFSIINNMRDSIKKERKIVKEDIKTLVDELNIIDESIVSINDKIQKLEEDNKLDHEKEVAKFKEELIKLNEEKKDSKQSLGKINLKYSQIESQFNTKNKELSNKKYELRSIENKLALYENSQCPTCSGDLNTEGHQKIKDDLIQKQTSINDYLGSAQIELENIVQNQRKVKEFQQKVDRNITKIETMISRYRSSLESILKDDKNESFTYLKQLIDENDTKRGEREKIKSERTSEDNFLDLCENILGDNGVKNLAVKTILPPLNNEISNMIKQMHLPYVIRFNDKFDCIIMHIGEKINPKSMSTGERKKVDFIIIVSMLKLLKIRYPSLNTLFLDEIFSSVDQSGVYEIVKILREVSKNQKMNTWVINHTELPTELFDRKVTAYREGGFSYLKNEIIQ